MIKILLQLFGASGVFPVFTNVFKINTVGRTSAPGDFVGIKDLETFSLSVNGKKENWTPMDLAGWERNAVTGKSLTISFKGKRNYGDAGNDFIASMLLATGQGCQSKLSWTMPNGANLTVDCVIDLKSPAGGDSTKIDALEFEILSDGLPVYTPAGVLSALTFVCVTGSVAGKTKVATVAPTLTGGNSYVYKVGAALSGISFANVLNTGAGWTPYILAADITASAGQQVVICEVDAGLTALKGGTSVAVPL